MNLPLMDWLSFSSDFHADCLLCTAGDPNFLQHYSHCEDIWVVVHASLSVLCQAWEDDPSDVISLAFEADRGRLCCKLTARRSNKRLSGWFMVNFRLSGFEAFSHLAGSKPWHICSCSTNLYNYFHNLTRSTPTALLDGNSKSLVLIRERGMQSVANHCSGNTTACLLQPIIILIKFSGRCLLKNNNYNSQLLSFLSSFRVSFIHMWSYFTTMSWHEAHCYIEMFLEQQHVSLLLLFWCLVTRREWKQHEPLIS